MAARRQRNRQRQRRGRFGFLYKLLSVLIVFAAVLVGCVVFFRVNRVEVIGNVRYSEAEVIAASGVEIGDNLFLVNRPRTNANLIRELPYIQKASMVRRLPDTIELHITESGAAAVVECEGEKWIIDPRGKFLENMADAGGFGADLPLVLGLHPAIPAVGEMMQVGVEEEGRLESLSHLLQALADRGMTAGLTDFIDLTSVSTIYFGYGEGLTVVVPVEEDMSWYAYALQQTMNQTGALKGTLYLTYGEKTARLLPDRWLPDEESSVSLEKSPENS